MEVSHGRVKHGRNLAGHRMLVAAAQQRPNLLECLRGLLISHSNGTQKGLEYILLIAAISSCASESFAPLRPACRSAVARKVGTAAAAPTQIELLTDLPKRSLLISGR